MKIGNEPMIDRVSRILLKSGAFKEIILFTKNFSLGSKYAVAEMDSTNGILIDSIIFCIQKYGEFLAVGGDMPYIDEKLIYRILDNYRGRGLTFISEGHYQPLFTIYNEGLYESLVEYRRGEGSSISAFMGQAKMDTIEDNTGRLRSVNNYEDLIEANKILGRT
jgi:molybdopterin-guanine dinucleotide biosynthesis protein A